VIVKCPYCGKQDDVECESGQCENVVTMCKGCGEMYMVNMQTGEVTEI